jgi:hypothetical protein
LSSALGDYNPGRDTYVPLLPKSLRQAIAEPFRHEIQADLSHETEIANNGPPNAFFPFKKLNRIEWPEQIPIDPDFSHFSLEGLPPYEPQDISNSDPELEESDE